MRSLLDGLSEDLGISPIAESFLEDLEDARDEREAAIEAAVKSVELSQKDIAAILDDNNDDNELADMLTDDFGSDETSSETDMDWVDEDPADESYTDEDEDEDDEIVGILEAMFGSDEEGEDDTDLDDFPDDELEDDGYNGQDGLELDDEDDFDDL